MTKNNPGKDRASERTEDRKSSGVVYVPPRLTVIGNVADLTRVGVSVGSVEAPEELG